MPRSKLVPFIPGEGRSRRHARRLGFNLQRQELVKSWAEKCGIDLKISNGGNHWTFTKGLAIAEWWPSSARLVLQREYRTRDQHVHDYQQVMAAVAAYFKKCEQELEEGGKE